MAADPRWDQLTQSSKAALRWGWAIAATRTEAAEAPDALVDPVDLLAGLALAHLRDNPVGQLFTHFDIPPGAVLSEGGNRRYDPAELLTTYRTISDAELPPLDEQTSQVLEHALSAMPSSAGPAEHGDGLVTLAMLFGALLEITNPASMALRTELANRGVDVEPVMMSGREYLGATGSYAEYLRQHHPYQRPEVQLPPYAPDEPRPRRTPGQPDAEPRDLVGITAEVNAFAYLIASRTLTPPLAIGLFGNWGSGKSYFLRSVQRRIDQVVSTEVDDPPFHRAIAQIEFNAWQYVEGNLWASLLEHLFRNLRKAGEQDADDLLEARRSEYLKQITARTAEHRRAIRKRDALAGEQQRAHELVANKRTERDRTLAKLEDARRRNPFLGWRPSPALADTLTEIRERTGLDELGTRLDEVQQTLVDTGETLRRAGPVLGALRAGGWRYTAALLVVLGIGPLVSVLLSMLDVATVANVITSGSALLAGVVGYAAQGSRVLAGTLGKISQAQAELNTELEARREQLNQEIRNAENKLASTQRELDNAVAEEQHYAASVAELEAELARITPISVLAEFLGSRSDSDDYRRHLGVPALVRQDLERLSRLIQQRHEAGAAAENDQTHAIDRIVLYIDDLDRCPTGLVIKVLEAVHLLLAFPLFVVVVAVDARWLESSLREHYSQLKADAAVPADYLEKIFQVPFWVRPLGADTRRQMVRGLLTPNLAASDSGDSNGENPAEGTELSDDDLPEFTRLVESFAVTDPAEQPWLEAAKLTVTGPELRLIEDVTPLIGPTPRAVKRFINVYLLLKSVGRSRGWPLPEQGQVAMLLAIATGLPALADELLPSLATPGSGALTLETALPATAEADAGMQLARLHVWLKDHPSWRNVALAGLDRWIELILRFRFDPVPTADSVRPA